MIDSDSIAGGRRQRNVVGYLFLAPYGASFLLFIGLPLVVSLVLAFCQYDMNGSRTLTFVGFRNFNEALNHDRTFWLAVRVTFTYVAMIIPSQLVLSLLLALGLNAMRRGQHTVRAMLFMPAMFSIAVTGILWQWFYNMDFGLFSHVLKNIGLPGIPWLGDEHLAMPAIIIMTLWWTLGGSAVILLNGLQQIPAQIHEASSIDGANRWQTFWQITLPMLKPVMTFMIVINTIGAFQMFAQAQLLTQGGPENKTRGMVQLMYDTAFHDYRLGYAAAISWMLFLMIASFSLIQFKLLRQVSE